MRFQSCLRILFLLLDILRFPVAKIAKALHSILAVSEHDQHEIHADHVASHNVQVFSPAATAKSAAVLRPLFLRIFESRTPPFPTAAD